jgi:polysaccharide biosynthesis protein PslH
MTVTSSAARPGNGALPGEIRVSRSGRPLKIAFVYSRLPLPMRRADQMTVAHLLAFLAARGHTIDFWTLDHGEPITDAQRAWLARQCRNVGLFRQWPWRIAWGVLRSLTTGRPLQCGWFANAAQRRAVRRALGQNDYDVAYVYLIRSAEILRGQSTPAAGRGRRPVTYLAMQVSQALNTRRIVDHSKRLSDRLVYRLEHLLTGRYEARVWKDFTRVVLIGPKDVEEVQTVCRHYSREVIDNYVYGPHGVDVQRFAPRGEDVVEPETVIFSGVLRTNTNIDAIRWFVHEIWPGVRRRRPDARLLVVGREPATDVVRLGRQPGVEVVGEVPEIGAWIARAAVCVNPMRACAGQQNKLLEYLAMGKAVVATSYANEGIEATPGRDLVVADDPEAFAEQVATLLRDRRRRIELGAAARRFIVDNWSWEALFLKLESSFYDALNERTAGVAKPDAAKPPAARNDDCPKAVASNWMLL